MVLYYKEERLTLYETLIKLYEEYEFQGKEVQEKIVNF